MGFDTPAFARRLEAAGVDTAHAEAVRDAVATRADLAASFGSLAAALLAAP